MYIVYDIKKGIQYAKLCISKRDGKNILKEFRYLGRVLNKERGIYQSRERGVFTYDLATNSYGNPPVEFVPPERKRKEILILDFGDSFFLHHFTKAKGLSTAIDAIRYGNPDTFYAMIFYYIVCSLANCHALSWWEGNYVRILYPKANLTSQRISDFLARIGDESLQREFFQEYFKLLDNTDVNMDHVLIDSTGLPNSIHFPLTAINNHNGMISNEVRLIYVVHQKTGMPIYFRYCAGNIIDASTLIRCLEELEAQGVNVQFAILDAGYYTGSNIHELFEKKIAFITRLKQNLVIYKQIVENHLDTLEEKENLVEYNGRYIFLKCVPCELEGHQAYAYIGLDIERKFSESNKTFQRAILKKMNTEQVYDTMQKQGIFILVASNQMKTTEVLPLYYTRQQIEQVFDIGKNYAGMLPVRVHCEDTFRGHLLLTFIATAIIKQIQTDLEKSSITPASVFLDLRNHKCKVYDDKIITHETFKKANDIYKKFKIECPVAIPR